MTDGKLVAGSRPVIDADRIQRLRPSDLDWLKSTTSYDDSWNAAIALAIYLRDIRNPNDEDRDDINRIVAQLYFADAWTKVSSESFLFLFSNFFSPGALECLQDALAGYRLVIGLDQAKGEQQRSLLEATKSLKLYSDSVAILVTIKKLVAHHERIASIASEGTLDQRISRMIAAPVKNDWRRVVARIHSEINRPDDSEVLGGRGVDMSSADPDRLPKEEVSVPVTTPSPAVKRQFGPLFGNKKKKKTLETRAERMARKQREEKLKLPWTGKRGPLREPRKSAAVGSTTRIAKGK